MSHHVSWATPPRWFTRELALLDPSLTVRWCNLADRWIIYHEDGSPSLRIEHPRTKGFRELDMRAIRKMRINIFFTHNDTALALYTDSAKRESEVNRELRGYINRGVDGISDYLSGWDKD